MVSIRRRILDKGELIKEQFIRTLQDHEDRIAAVEGGEAGETADITALQTTVGDEDGGLVKDMADVKTAIGDESTEGTILARIKALEDAG
jgi:hypothetical protein